MSEQEEIQEKRRRKDRWVLWLILALFLVGLAIRGYGYVNQESQQTSRHISSGQSLSPFQKSLTDSGQRTTLPKTSRESGEWDIVTQLAPYLTEGGLSFFIGFCIGFFLRVVAKTAVFVVGGLYVALILLSHYGLVTVDWGGFQHVLQQLLLNTQEQIEGIQGVLAVGVPSVAMGGLGIWRGLKKG
jgi:uncharacterized membrane protein (Fun14 family)